MIQNNTLIIQMEANILHKKFQKATNYLPFALTQMEQQNFYTFDPKRRSSLSYKN